MPYQTRHFKAVYEIFDKDLRIATLAADPHSDILKFNSGLLKLDNQVLYQVNLLAYVQQLLKDLDLKFNSYSRLDIALDFYTFARGLKCDKFINNFLNSDYAKLGRCCKGRIAFETKNEESGQLVKLVDGLPAKNVRRSQKRVQLQTLKFGAETSDTTYYLYNKTKELEQVKMKPWIVDNWKANNWDSKTDVWRLEFSLKSNTDAIVDPESGSMITLKDIEAIEHITDIYKFCLKKYFSFVHNEKKRKDRNKPVVLFAKDFATDAIKIKMSDKKDSTRSTKIFAKALQLTNQELRGHDFNLAIYGNSYLTHVIKHHGLEDWAKRKLVSYTPSLSQEAKHSSDVSIMMLQTDIEFETLDLIRPVRSRLLSHNSGITCQPLQLKPILK
jgi:hypothetical protein